MSYDILKNIKKWYLNKIHSKMVYDNNVDYNKINVF